MSINDSAPDMAVDLGAYIWMFYRGEEGNTGRYVYSLETYRNGKLKLKNSDSRELIISFEAENLAERAFTTVSVYVSESRVLLIDSNQLAGSTKKIKEVLTQEPADGDKIEIIRDGVQVICSKFDKRLR